MKILIIEDDVSLNKSLKTGLESAGYAVTSFHDGAEGEKHILLNAMDYDLLILDWSLPGKTGVEVCQDVRKKGIKLPVLMLTARDSAAEKVEALDMGADDYLTKPFSFEELLARVRALLRRPHEVMDTEIAFGDISMNTSTRKVMREGKEIPLTLKEFNILEYFIRHPNKVLTRDEVLDHVWDYNFSSMSNIMDVHINNLRKKLNKGKRENYIETVRGVGYKFRQE